MQCSKSGYTVLWRMADGIINAMKSIVSGENIEEDAAAVKEVTRLRNRLRDPACQSAQDERMCWPGE